MHEKYNISDIPNDNNNRIFDNSVTKNYILKLNKNILYYTEKSLIQIDNVNRT